MPWGCSTTLRRSPRRCPGRYGIRSCGAEPMCSNASFHPPRGFCALCGAVLQPRLRGLRRSRGAALLRQDDGCAAASGRGRTGGAGPHRRGGCGVDARSGDEDRRAGLGPRNPEPMPEPRGVGRRVVGRSVGGSDALVLAGSALPVTAHTVRIRRSGAPTVSGLRFSSDVGMRVRCQNVTPALICKAPIVMLTPDSERHCAL